MSFATVVLVHPELGEAIVAVEEVGEWKKRGWKEKSEKAKP